MREKSYPEEYANAISTIQSGSSIKWLFSPLSIVFPIILAVVLQKKKKKKKKMSETKAIGYTNKNLRGKSKYCGEKNGKS